MRPRVTQSVGLQLFQCSDLRRGRAAGPQGEVPPGAKPFFKLPIFYYHHARPRALRPLLRADENPSCMH